MWGLTLFADTSGAIKAIQDYVTPTIQVFAGLAGIACAFFIAHAGYLYMTSRGNPERLEQAKHVIKNAMIGVAIVFAAVALTSILSHAFGSPHDISGATLPNIQSLPPDKADNGFFDIVTKAITGFLVKLINSAASPFLNALDFFTKSTPLMEDNKTVLNFWLAMVGISDVVFALIVALLGMQVMSAATFGFDEIEFKHLLPRFGLTFLLMNSSIYLIDRIIDLSNALITAVDKNLVLPQSGTL